MEYDLYPLELVNYQV